MYWLKPFDAVNDTANAIALLNFDWSKSPILEIGGGDGVFSFIMHGGKFAFEDDRYGQTDTSIKGDIYDIYKEELKLRITKEVSIKYDTGLDLKLSHLYKSRETGIYKNLISSISEKLPLQDNFYSTVFLYTFHGLFDYSQTLKEIRRVIKKDGTLLMIAVNDTVKQSFICFNLHEYCKRKGWTKLSDYLSDLDGGRYQEIGTLFSKSMQEWKELFQETGFQIEEVYSQVSSLLWKIYDTQTRPFLKFMIRMNQILKNIHLKKLIKFLWVAPWLPVLYMFYLLLAKPVRVSLDEVPKGVFLAIKVRPNRSKVKSIDILKNS